MPGIAESARLVLFLGNVAFEDERISRAEVMLRRSANKLPYGQVPTLTINNSKEHGQSNAILRWAGKLVGLYPEEFCLECDGIIEALSDIRSRMLVFDYNAALARHPITSELVLPLHDNQKAQVGPYFNDVFLPARLEQLERILVSRGGLYFCGDRMTI